MHMENKLRKEFRLTNAFVKMSLDAYRAELGENGLNVLFNYAGLYHFIDDPIPDNFEQGMHFNEFSAIQSAALAVYGERAFKILSWRIGSQLFTNHLQFLIPLKSVLQSKDFETLPKDQKIELSLLALAKVLNRLSDQEIEVKKREGTRLFIVNSCAVCWEQSVYTPNCFFTDGIISACLHYLQEDIIIGNKQVKSRAAGSQSCIFEINLG